MGKRGRRARREGRARRVPTRSPLTVAVVTHPSSRKAGVSLHGDADLVRASVLYADHVELVSMGALMVATQAQLAAGDGSELLRLITELDDQTLQALAPNFPTDQSELIRQFPPLLNSPALDRVGLGRERRALKAQLAEAQAGLRRRTDSLLEKSGAEDLLPGFEAGVVSLSSAGFEDAADLDMLMERWLAVLKDLLKDPRKRLLFDEDIAGLVAAMVKEKKVTLPPLARRHAGEVAVGTGLIARLPAFPQAPLGELLDMRSELSAPLTCYRAAVMEMSDKLRAQVFEPELQAEVDDLWLSQVEPALVDIEESFAQHGLVREIAKSAATDVKALLVEGAAFYVGLEHLSSLEGWLSAAAAIGPPTLHAAATGALATAQGRRKAIGHDLYFLYQAQRRMR